MRPSLICLDLVLVWPLGVGAQLGKIIDALPLVRAPGRCNLVEPRQRGINARTTKLVLLEGLAIGHVTGRSLLNYRTARHPVLPSKRFEFGGEIRGQRDAEFVTGHLIPPWSYP